jgi:hypothetical protein
VQKKVLAGNAVITFATDNPPAGLRAVLAIAPTGSPGRDASRAQAVRDDAGLLRR